MPRSVIGLVGLCAVIALVGSSRADRDLLDYRWFRALSIDLQGRMPSRAELQAFAQPDFDLDGWIEAHLVTPEYAARISRIYMDVLRLEVGPSFQFVHPPVVLRRETILGPDKKELYVFFRRGQRRADPATDGEFCLTPAQTGLTFPQNGNGATVGTPKPVSQKDLDRATVEVKPWWLYADYRNDAPKDLYGPEWGIRFPGFVPVPALLHGPDGTSPTTSVRVCREEAQTATTGVVVPGNKKETPFVRRHKGRAISCLTTTGFQNSPECGCGVGLERCIPAAGPQFDPPAFVIPTHTPLGANNPFELTPQPQSAWERFWWGQEAVHFLDDLFLNDRDFREILTSRATLVNGPLTQFYRDIAPSTCCGQGQELDYTDPAELLDPAALPAAMLPEDTATWMRIDRGPRASGILTMPIFLTKYGSRRARAHVVYNAFLCKDFVAENVALAPSDEPDLAKRPGCATCHATLEPLAAYFSRIAESDWTFLPPDYFPLERDRCKVDEGKKSPGYCRNYYDASLGGTLRGTHASVENAEKGVAGIAEAVMASPDLARCVVTRVSESFLGRPLGPDDAALAASLTKTFVDGGYRMRPLVRALVKSDVYRRGNDLVTP
jgi:hypothetical protein